MGSFGDIVGKNPQNNSFAQAAGAVGGNSILAPLGAGLGGVGLGRLASNSGLSSTDLGTNTNFSPSGVPFQQPFNAQHGLDQYNQNQGIISQQQNFVNALNAQGGVGNQAAVFAQQQALANQLQQQAQGGGPNPALAQLNQTTGQNMQNQAALMASQRGASANPALTARNAAQQGSQIQQQAAGQAATLRAQQQLGAIQALQAQQGQMAGLSSQQIGQQAGAQQQLGNMGLGQQGQVLGSIAATNNTQAGMQQNINSVRGGLEGTSMQGRQGLAGGLLGGLGMGAAMFGGGGGAAAGASPAMFAGLAKGGVVPKAKNYFVGGMEEGDTGGDELKINSPEIEAPQTANGPLSRLGKAMQTGATSMMPAGGNPLQVGAMQFGAGMGKLGKSYMNSPQEPTGEQTAAHGGKIKSVGQKLKSGGNVPGKAKVSGDSLKNDTVNAKLSPGEIVIPRSIINGKDPVKNAAAFVASILARQGGR